MSDDGELHGGGDHVRRCCVDAVDGGADNTEVGIGRPVDEPDDESYYTC